MRRLLVVSTAFPEYEGDYKGIFVADYIKTIRHLYNVSVFSPRLKASEAGLVNKKYQDIDVEYFAVTKKKSHPLWKMVLYFIFYIRVIRICRKINTPDIIHVHGSIFIGGVIGLMLGRRHGCPVVYTEHMGRIDKEFTGSISGFLYKYLVNSFDLVTTVSEYMKKKLVNKGILEKKIVLIPNPVDTKLFDCNDVEKKEQILFVGRFDENKGVLRVISAFEIVADYMKELKLVLIGDGNQKLQVENMIANSKYSDRIICHNIISKKELTTIMQSSKVLVAPSIIESFCVTVAEAMSCGLPVVVGKGNATNEYVNEKAGEIVDSCSIVKISEAINKILYNYQSYKHSEIRSIVTDNFSYNAVSEKLQRLYSISK